MRFFRSAKSYAERIEELESYVQIETEANLARGMAPEEALAAARRKLGNSTRVREEIYTMSKLTLFDSLGRDVRYALRGLIHNLTFTTVAVLTLALGIGANTAVFSVVNSVLLKPLPYPHADELVSVQHTAPGAAGLIDASGDLRPSASMFFTYADHNKTFEHIGGWSPGYATLTGQGEPEELRTIAVTHGTLEALGVPPVAGRWLSKEDQDPASRRTVMLGYGYWQRKFGGDKSVVGRSIVLNAVPMEVVGVMPQGFRIVDTEADLIAPFRFNRAQLILPGFFLRTVARLKPGATLASASADIARMIPVWMSSWPAPPNVDPRNWERWKITPELRPLKQDVVGRVSSVLWVVMGTIGIVLLIACANVANLLLVRVEARQQELAVRAALGAGWGRIVRELLLESTLLGVIGGLFGLGLAHAGLRILVAVGPATLPRLNEIGVDLRVLGFTMGVSVLSGMVFGLIPALKYAGSRISLRVGTRTATQGREHHRASNLLVIGQVALALVLLVSAGLMIRTFDALRRVEPGFTRPEQIQTMRIAIPQAMIPELERVARMQNQILDNLAALPGVSSVGFATTLPADGLPPNWDSVRAEGQELPAGEFPPLRRWKNVSPGFFEAMGTRLIAGRDYTWTDLYGRRPVVMISENLAREFWGSASDAVGKRLGATDWREVIGVVQDVRDNGIQQPSPETVYWPSYGSSPYNTGTPTPAVSRNVTFTIRSARAGTEGFLSQVQQAVWAVNPTLPVAQFQTMADLHNKSMAATSFTLVMLAIAGTMALALGAIGIYGVISYAASQRKREIGIRLALGAQQGAVKQMFVRNAVTLAAVGVAIGLGAAAGLTRLMSSLLFASIPSTPSRTWPYRCLWRVPPPSPVICRLGGRRRSIPSTL